MGRSQNRRRPDQRVNDSRLADNGRVVAHGGLPTASCRLPTANGRTAKRSSRERRRGEVRRFAGVGWKGNYPGREAGGFCAGWESGIEKGGEIGLGMEGGERGLPSRPTSRSAGGFGRDRN